jgi:hypothetical protein
LDSDSPDDASECPICFLNFEELNMVTCCKQMICSECYLLVKKTAARENNNRPCPFCSISNLTVIYTPQLMSKKTSDTSIPISSSNMSKTDSSEEKASGILSSPFSSPSPASTCHSTPSTSGSTASSRGFKKEIYVPLSSITDRNEIEKEIQGMRLKFSDDRPPTIPRSSRSNYSRGGENNDLSRTFARRNYLSSASEYNTSRGTMNDLEHAALRLRFAVAIGERSHGMFGHPSEGIDRGRDHNSMAEYLESRVVGRRSYNDLERIEEMMMMEVKLSPSYQKSHPFFF